MSARYTDSRFGALVERQRNFASYLTGTAEWNEQNVEIWVMGRAGESCMVRPASLLALGLLFDDQQAWTQRVRDEVVTRLYPKLKDQIEVEHLGSVSFWKALRLVRVLTDDDFAFEFVYDTSGAGLTQTICVYGQPDIGIEEAFVDPSEPNPSV